MRKRQGGQALILVLILLAVGALLIVPSLRLTSTTLRNNRIYLREMEAMYAADAAQEWILWKLTYDTVWRTQYLSNDGDTVLLQYDACGVPVEVTIIMRALEGEGGITLAGDDVIRPTKTVAVEGYPEWINDDGDLEVPDGSSQTYTYTIKLEQLSSDNSVRLDAVYDILPDEFSVSDYVTGSSTLSVDGGPWESIPDPLKDTTGGQVRLQWPATYAWDDVTKTGTGGFDTPMRDFEVRQEKEISFQVTGNLLNNRTYYNWVVLKMEDGTNTLSGPSAPIITGSGSTPEGGLLETSKVSVPELIQPGVVTEIEYTISITNLEGNANQLQEITDYLPPEFTYIAGSSGFDGGSITTAEPQLSLENLNGVDRWVLRWTTAEFGGGEKSIAAGETLTQAFKALTSQNVSGSYYNEIKVTPNTSAPPIFDEIGVTNDDFNTTYSWNTGMVLVPFYDGRTDAGAVTINSNIALILGGVAINSWQVD